MQSEHGSNMGQDIESTLILPKYVYDTPTIKKN